MARLTYVAPAGDVTTRIRERRGGRLTALDGVLLHSPELADGTGSVSGALQVCVSTPDGTAVGSEVTVKAWFTFSWLPVLHLSPASTTVTRSATMRIEVPPTDPFFAGAPVCA